MLLFMKKGCRLHYNSCMSLETLPDPILVHNRVNLNALVDTLSRQALVAVDTEANSLYAYQERVCLIQFSTPDDDYLVDPLVLGDLSPLGSIFCNPKIEKIFHAAEYDILLLKRDFNFRFNNIFDTMVAARILGWESVGLSSILQSQFGITVNKKYQRANWGKRPLPTEMLIYAQLDTHYLIRLRNQLRSELISKRRWDLAEEDFHRGSQIDINDHVKKTKNCWRINGVQDLNQQQTAILHELCLFREQVAEAADRPLFKVINDTSLVKIATSMPGSLMELENIHGISLKQARWIGKGLISAVQRGKKKHPPRQQKARKPDDQHLDRIKQLRLWRKTKARCLNVESDVVLPKDLLLELASENPQTQEEINKILKPVPWRLNKFGEEILHLLQKITT